MTKRSVRTTGLVGLLFLTTAFIPAAAQTQGGEFDEAAAEHASRMIEEGRQIFRFDTFGSEDFWGGQLRLHEAIMGEALGGVGPGVSPQTALEVGLKVDVNAVPQEVAEALSRGEIDLADPASTLVLLKANAVVGVTGFFSEDGETLTSVGIQCSLCHSTVDDAFAPGIGHRLDGWPNRDLNVGAIVNLAPDLSAFVEMLEVEEATVRSVLTSWGPGRYDAELSLDGKATTPDGKPATTLIPAAFGLAGVEKHTWTGWGSVTYWNAYVANLQMHGKGSFYDPRLDDAEKFPVSARTRSGHTQPDGEDLVTAKLPALHFYQLSLPTPRPPEDSFDSAAAERGEALFNDKAGCAACHVPPLFTEPGWNMHTAQEIGIDDFQAMRSPDERYRTEPLRALWNTEKIHKGGFYHDGRFATLAEVVDHYDGHFDLQLSDEEKQDLIEYLKSI
jgi:mono/diheme cytochrome c family protein